jgi:hypothetical protein
MFYKKPAVRGAKLIAFTYQFLEPCLVKKQEVDGTINLVRYGIGDKIEIMEPDAQLLIALYEKAEEIPLIDGSKIIEFPDDISLSYCREEK